MFSFIKNLFTTPALATPTKTIKVTWDGPEINRLPDGRYLLLNNGKTYARRRDAVRGYNRLNG